MKKRERLQCTIIFVLLQAFYQDWQLGYSIMPSTYQDSLAKIILMTLYATLWLNLGAVVMMMMMMIKWMIRNEEKCTHMHEPI
jgi:uncharacterized membrane protein